TPLASAPSPPLRPPDRLNRAKSAVRSSPLATWASTACSVGRNTLTSTAEGFSVPRIATSRSGQNVWNHANPMPVASMSPDAASSTRRGSTRCATSPTSIVSTADPTSVPVTIAPISNDEKPSRTRCAASSTLTMPSANPRRPRVRRMVSASRVMTTALLAQQDVEGEPQPLERTAERVVVDVPPQRHQEPALELVAERRLAAGRHGSATRRFELRDDLRPRMPERLEIGGVELVDERGDQREHVGLARDLRRPAADRAGDGAGVTANAGRITEALELLAALAVLDCRGLEGHVEILADAPEVRLGLLHQLLVSYVDQGHRLLAHHPRQRGNVAREDRVVRDGDLVVAIEEGLDVGRQHRQRMAGEHDVAGAGIEPDEEGQDERVRGRLVEEVALARSGREDAPVERVGVCAQRVEIVGFAARQLRDQLLDRLRDVGRIVRRLLDGVEVAEVRDRGDQMRLGTSEDLRVRG